MGTFMPNPFVPSSTGSGFGEGGGMVGGGIGNTLGNLFQNKLFLQYLSSFGAGIGGDSAKAINAVTQQSITNQNYSKLLKRMLGGDMPKDAKVVHTADGTDIHMPKSALDGEASMAPTTLATAPTPAQATTPQTVAPINPFTPNQSFNPSDLAGLTPEMITQALQMRMQQDALRNKTIQETIDQGFKGRQVAVAEREVAVNEAHQKTLEGKGPEPLDQVSPYTSPGVGRLTNRQFSELTPDEKNYTIYATALGPDVKPMSRREFQLMEPTAQLKFLKELMNDPKAMAAEKSLRESSAIKLPPAQQSFETAKGNQKAFVTGPEFMSSTIEELKKEKSRTWDNPPIDNPDDIPNWQKLQIMTRMEQKLKSVFGKGNVKRGPLNIGWIMVDKSGNEISVEYPK